MTPRLALRPVGDRGFLVELSDNRQVHLLAAAVRERFGAQIEDVVPGEETLLLRWAEPPPPVPALTDALRTLDLGAASADPPPKVTIPVHYDGADLDAVADALELDVARVVELHTEPEYVVAFMGFSPGFAYMTGGSPALRLPRRQEPRSRIPAGSVAIASTYSAVYPTSGPGGWHLLGHTDEVLFDPQRDPPALLEAGGRVVFEPR